MGTGGSLRLLSPERSGAPAFCCRASSLRRFGNRTASRLSRKEPLPLPRGTQRVPSLLLPRVLSPSVRQSNCLPTSSERTASAAAFLLTPVRHYICLPASCSGVRFRFARSSRLRTLKTAQVGVPLAPDHGLRFSPLTFSRPLSLSLSLPLPHKSLHSELFASLRSFCFLLLLSPHS